MLYYMVKRWILDRSEEQSISSSEHGGINLTLTIPPSLSSTSNLDFEGLSAYEDLSGIDVFAPTSVLYSHGQVSSLVKMGIQNVTDIDRFVSFIFIFIYIYIYLF